MKFKYRQSKDILYIFKMTKMSLLLIIALISAVVVAQDKDKERPVVQQAVQPFSGTFALSWYGGFCASGKCGATQYALWDKESFTIHGLWPSARTEHKYANFDVDNIQDKDLLDDMQNYWPPQSNDDKDADWLWSHEYDKHGKDFANILQLYLPHEYERATARQLQQTYFQTVINYYKTFNVRKLDISRASPKPERNSKGDLLVSKDQISSIIGVPSENFIVSCSGKKGENYLAEIKICFRVDQNIDFALENCLKIKSNGQTPYSMNDNCPTTKPFRLVDFKADGTAHQERVNNERPNSLVNDL